MRTRSKVLIGSALVLIGLVLSAFLFLRYQVHKSFPQTEGHTTVLGLTSPVQVIRDEYGVPRIHASTERDLFIALGFVHAQDRLWQMDMARRVGEGRLSEIFGSVTVPFDKMFRIVGIKRIAESIESGLTNTSRERLQWYAQGVNSFIDDNKGKYPVEFDLLGYVPEPWSPVHSIIIGRLMAWELNLSWWVDLTYASIAEKVGLERALDIFPPYPHTVPPIVPSSEWHKYAGLGTSFLNSSQMYAAMFGTFGMLGGSNAWVVGPEKSASGKVILANDTHLQLQVPSKWYEVHLTSPTYEVAGMSIPGIPGIVVGHNKYITWGVTNVMADDADFYIERIHPTDSTRYLYNNEWRTIEERREELVVRGDSTLIITVRSTHHGPIVTDIETPLQRQRHPFVASLRWTGAEPSDQINAFYLINKATEWKEFVAGVREFTGPGQNFVYGDINGNIGYWCGVKLPLRGKQHSILPLPGWDPSTEWKGYVPFEKLPHMINPRQGYIATANNKIVDDSYPFHISVLWEPPSRIERLHELLHSDRRWSSEDFEKLQNDAFSHYAKELTPYLMRACIDVPLGIPEEGVVLEYLRNWNFTFSEGDIVTAIFQEFLVRFLENTFLDEMGADAFHDWVLLANIPLRVSARLIQEGTSPWFDNVSTETHETRNMIICKSLVQAIENLKGRLGPETKSWRWGDMHTLVLRHPFGLRKPLDRIFNIGPYPYGGGSTSLRSGEYNFNTPFEVTVGASFRYIYDFARPREVRTILPTGQSGQVLHPHYSDQTSLWKNGAYRTVRAAAPQEGGSWKTLVLEPRL